MKEIQTLKKLRLELGLTQKQLAEKLSCAPLTVLRWENNIQTPRPIFQKEIKRIIKQLEKSVSKFPSKIGQSLN